MAAVMDGFNRVVASREAREGNDLMRRGKMPQAVRRFQSALAQDPQCVDALRGLGEATFRDGRYDLSTALFVKALEFAPDDGKLWGWRGTAELAEQKPVQAAESFRRAIGLGCELADVYRGLGRAAADQGQWEEAERCWLRGLQIDPHAKGIAALLGNLNLRRGNWLTGWQGWATRASRQRHNTPLPHWGDADLDGRDVLVIGNQGIGDELFFLRFSVPGLAARGARLIYRCDPKIESLLRRVDGIHAVVPEYPSEPVPEFARVANHAYACIGDDFPLALGDAFASGVMPSLRLEPESARVERLRARLEAIGPAPWIGTTWRAGAAPDDKQFTPQRIDLDNGHSVRPTVMFKEAPLESLGAVLKPLCGTVIAVQRKPRAGELDELSAMLGRAVGDFTALNDDLEDMLALMSLLDDYVCVSNTNVHLRCLAGLPSRVLVPFPGPDWRWGIDGDTSPWYPGSRIYRQGADMSWQLALERLAEDLLRAGYGAVEAPEQVADVIDASAATSPVRAADEAADPLADSLQAAHDLLSSGHNEAAKSAFIALLQQRPEWPPALHGLARTAHTDGRYDLALPLLQKALAAQPDNAQWIGDLGLTLLSLDRHDEAARCLESARQSGIRSAHQARARAYLALLTGDFRSSIALCHEALQIDPAHRSAAGMLARLHLARGDWADGWRHMSAQPLRAAPFALASRQPWDDVAELRGKRVRVIGNEGLGDELFALRFAEAMRAHGARIDLVAGAKLAPVLARQTVFDTVSALAVGACALPETAGPEPDFTVLTSDLPRLLWSAIASPTPDPFPLKALDARIVALRARLEALGPRPWTGVTWRAGNPASGVAAERIHRAPDGQVVKVRVLSKQAPADELAAALAGMPGTLIALQRNAAPGEVEAFAAACGRPVVDLTALSDDFEELLALLTLLDDYVGVSNTNVHLRASAGLPSRVLLPHPVPEWRWMLEGEASPWFPGCRLYRQTATGDWSEALTRLRCELGGEPESRTVAGRKVFWVTHGAIELRQGEPWSSMASTRLRVLSPARELKVAGVDSRFLSERSCPAELSGDDAPAPEDILVVSKSFDTDTTKLLLQTKRRGTRVVVDLCDNHFDHPEHGPHVRFLCAAADVLVANTEAMRDAIREKTGRDAVVIADPYEGAPAEPRFAPGEVLKLLWFGHPVNLDTLAAALPGLGRLSQRRRMALTIVTAPCEHEAQLRQIAGDALPVDFVPWSTEATVQALADCDLVIVPTLDAATKQTRSANRMVEALRAGRFVVAGPQPSHMPFAKAVRIDADIAAGVEWTLEHAADIVQRIVCGQKMVAERHAPPVVAAQWKGLLDGMVAADEVRPDQKQLWDTLHEVLRHHDAPEYGSIEVLNRIVRKLPALAGCEVPVLMPAHIALSLESRPLAWLSSLMLPEQQIARAPTHVGTPLLVLEWGGQDFLIDGRRRIAHWLRSGEQGPHPVLRVRISGVDFPRPVAVPEPERTGGGGRLGAWPAPQPRLRRQDTARLYQCRCRRKPSRSQARRAV